MASMGQSLRSNCKPRHSLPSYAMQKTHGSDTASMKSGAPGSAGGPTSTSRDAIGSPFLLMRNSVRVGLDLAFGIENVAQRPGVTSSRGICGIRVAGPFLDEIEWCRLAGPEYKVAHAD